MARTGSADKVTKAVHALSDDLLVDEDNCKVAMEGVFLARVEGLAHEVRSAHDAGEPVGGRRLVTLVQAAGREVVAGTADPVRGLVLVAVGKGLEGIRAELNHCEAVLPRRYRGLADEACDRLDDSGSDLVALAMASYAQQSLQVTAWLEGQLEIGMGIAQLNHDSKEDVVARLFAADPVRLTGHSGRGLWWQAVLWLNQIVREVEFATVNAGRLEAMRVFNELGDTVDGSGL